MYNLSVLEIFIVTRLYVTTTAETDFNQIRQVFYMVLAVALLRIKYYP